MSSVTRTRIGEMRERVTFQTLTSADSDFGDGEPDWSDSVTVWADVRLNPQRESEGPRDSRSQVLEAVIRYRTDLSQDMRVIVRGMPFDVTSVADEEGRKRFTVIRGVWRA